MTSIQILKLSKSTQLPKGLRIQKKKRGKVTQREKRGGVLVVMVLTVRQNYSHHKYKMRNEQREEKKDDNVGI